MPCNASQGLYDLMLSLGYATSPEIEASYGELYHQFQDPSLEVTFFFFDLRSNEQIADALLREWLSLHALS